MIVYPFIHPSAIGNDGVFSQAKQDAWEEEDRIRIIKLNRLASERLARIGARYGDGSDGRDVAAEVVMRLDSKGRPKW